MEEVGKKITLVLVVGLMIVLYFVILISSLHYHSKVYSCDPHCAIAIKGAQVSTDTPTTTVTSTPIATARCEYAKFEKGVGVAVGAGALDDCIDPTKIAFQDPNVDGVIENTTTEENIIWTSSWGGSGLYSGRSGSYIESETYLPFVVEDYCSNLQTTAVAQAATTPSPSAPYNGQGNVIDTLTATPFSGGASSPSSRDLGQGGIFFKDTDLSDPLIISGGYFSGCGTLLVEGSDIYISGNIFFATPEPTTEMMHCLGLVACKDPVTGVGGNIFFLSSVNKAAGNYLAEDTIYTGISTSNELAILGSLAADHIELERSLDFFVTPSWTPIPSENVTFYPGILSNPPPGFSEKNPFIEWIEIPGN